MPSPFPGMDPYLEKSDYWSSFHSRFIVGLADAIATVLQDNYYVEVETRTYLNDGNDNVLVGIPDAAVLETRSTSTPIPPDQPSNQTIVQTFHPSPTAVLPQPQSVTVPMPTAIKERYLEIREMGSDRVITVIELLSPKNKRSGNGRTVYEAKRASIFASLTHLVEIDFLRGGKPMPLQGQRPESIYSILVSRSHQRPLADFYGFNLQDPLPSFCLSLDPRDSEPIVTTQDLFNGIYDRARYQARIDYTQAPPPPRWSQSDQVWLQHLQAHL